MNEEYQSGSYQSYNSRTQYSHLNTKAKHTQNKYQKTAGSLVVFLILLGIAALVCFIISAVKSGNLANLRHEYYNYTSMIERAKSDPAYETTAEITGRYYDTEYDAYYLTYDIDYHFFFSPIKGETPALFDLEDLDARYQSGETIKVALSDKFENISMFTDSIIMDLENIELNDFLNYRGTETAKEVTKTLAFAFIGIAAVLVVVIIALYTKGKKVKEKTAALDTTSNSNVNNTANNYACEYCGAHVGLKSKCPACGATKKRN